MSWRAAAVFMRAVLFLLAITGVFGVAPIALSHLKGVETCPVLVIVPACYVAFTGYGLVALSALLPRARSWYFAVAGLLPVLGLAATGTGFELAGVESCPRSSSGNPMCFYSLGLGVVLAVAYVAFYRLSRPSL